MKRNRLPDGASAAGPMLLNLDDQDGTGVSTLAEPSPNPRRTLGHSLRSLRLGTATSLILTSTPRQMLLKRL